MLETKDAKDVATSIGRSKRYVAECRRIAESLTPGAKKEITRKGFPVVPRECLALIASIPLKEQLRFIENVEDHGAHLLADADWVRSSIFEEMAPLGDDCPFSQADEGLAPEAGPCTTCPKRTGADQDLFGGIFAKADKCGDPACYAAKLETHANRAIAEALKKNPEATPDAAELNAMIKEWRTRAPTRWDDVGFKITGDSRGIRWLSHSLARDDFELDIDGPANPTVIPAEALLTAIELQRDSMRTLVKDA